jgi:predicted HAD superfamily Cof-like phosphohydrolase
MSDAVLVKQFTEESGHEIPKEPTLMSKDEVYFLIKMMLDEIMELGATVDGPNEVKTNMINMINASKSIPKETCTGHELIAAQADALVDCYYYSQNAAVKKGVNLSSVFNIVHKANMDKRDKTTGKFIKREDGKIVKPEGWMPPDITAEISRQARDGAWA